MMFGSYPYPGNIIENNTIEFINVYVKPGKPPKFPADAKIANELTRTEWLDLAQQVWFMYPEDVKREGDHPAPFPEKLPARLMRLYTYGAVADFPGEVVLDPFVGTGTTCAIAKSMGRRYIGIDIDPTYVKIAEKRVRDAPGFEPLLLVGRAKYPCKKNFGTSRPPKRVPMAGTPKRNTKERRLDARLPSRKTSNLPSFSRTGWGGWKGMAKSALPKEWRQFANRYGADLAVLICAERTGCHANSLIPRLRILKEFEGGRAWRDCQQDYVQRLNSEGISLAESEWKEGGAPLARMLKQVFSGLGLAWVTPAERVQVTPAGEASPRIEGSGWRAVLESQCKIEGPQGYRAPSHTVLG